MVCITIPYVQLHYLFHFQIILETDSVHGGKKRKALPELQVSGVWVSLICTNALPMAYLVQGGCLRICSSILGEHHIKLVMFLPQREMP